MILNRLGYETRPVDWELSEATRQALINFRTVAGLGPKGEVTMPTVIELGRLRAGE